MTQRLHTSLWKICEKTIHFILGKTIAFTIFHDKTKLVYNIHVDKKAQHNNINTYTEFKVRLWQNPIIFPSKPTTPPPFLLRCSIYHGGRGHWAVYYTSPQSFTLTFSNSQ